MDRQSDLYLQRRILALVARAVKLGYEIEAHESSMVEGSMQDAVSDDDIQNLDNLLIERDGIYLRIGRLMVARSDYGASNIPLFY